MPTSTAKDAFLRTLENSKMRGDDPDPNFRHPSWAYLGVEPTAYQRAHIADSDYYFKKTSALWFYLPYETEAWLDAHDAIRRACEVKKAKAAKLGGPEDERSCSCEDDNRNIPCDGVTYERTFGPVQPSWPDKKIMGEANIDAVFRSRAREGMEPKLGAA